MSAKMGGPGVNTYQPPEVWEEMSFNKIRYRQGGGDDLYRRSLYIFWRRIVGPTMFFDSADRQVCEVKGKRTNTPLHALAVMNDPAYVEAGRALAVAVLEEKDLSDKQRIALLYRKVLGRLPTSEESGVLMAGLERLKRQYAAQPEKVRDYLRVGVYKTPGGIDAVSAAAYANLSLMVLNLDETLSRE